MTGQPLQPLQLQRTTYRNPNTGHVRLESTTCGENALDMEQYYQPLERFHAASLHGWGIAAGLRVAATLNNQGITVLPGIAVDSNGLHILLVSGGQAEISKVTPGTTPLAPVSDGGVVIPTTTLTGDQYLIVQFWETFDSPAQQSIGAFRYTHTPWLHFVDAADLVHDGSVIILAKVSFDSGANAGQVIAIAQDMRQRADWHVEQTQEASIHGPGVAAGLGVTVTLNSPGITVLPGLALDSNGQYISLASGDKAEIGATADAPGAQPNLVAVTTSGAAIPTTGLTGDKYLTIQFWETPASSALASTLQSVAPYHFIHTPWLRLVDTASFVNDATRLILAKVSFGTGANAGLVTNLAQDQRQTTDLGVGSIHLLKSALSSLTTTARAVDTREAGVIRATASGLAITVPNASDEVHLERDNGGNFAKVSLGAEQIVARQANGQESVIIDTAAGSISATNITASGAIMAGNFSTAGDVTANNITANMLTTLNVGPGIRQNRLYLSGGVGGSSLTYNAHRNEATNDWVFPDRTHPAVTLEMDDWNGTPRFQVWSTTSGSPTSWQERFAIDGNSGSIWAGGSFSASGSITANGSITTNGSIIANGEVAIKNAPGAETVVLNANAATIEVGGSGANGVINVYDKSHNAVIALNGENGKITTKILKAGGVTAQGSGGGWALGGFASQNTVGLRAGNGSNQADLGTPNLAGDFSGPVNISGSLHVSGPIIKSGGGFKIDHPLDPEHKYLTHSFVESPDMKNIYDGVAVLDANGEATVELPAWFAALNRDVRYQLTCIGDYAPIYIARKMQDNCFTIAGGKPEMEVSWQVTGIRQDAWACVNRLCTEEEKPPAEQSHSLHP